MTTSERAKFILKKLPSWKAFWFYNGIGEYTGLFALSLAEFIEKIEDVDIKSIEFHVSRGDFEKWIEDAIGDHELVVRIKEIATKNVKGEELRNDVLKTLKIRLKELARIAFLQPHGVNF